LKFSYKARDVEGKVVSGEIDAPTPQVAERKLRGEGLYPLNIRPIRKGGLGGDISIPFLKSKVKIKHVAIFTRQLAAMIGAGIPLPTAINTLSQQVTSKKLAQILTEIREDVEGGSKFSEALKRHPDTFSKLYISMVEAGEASGTLDLMLNRWFIFIEKILALRRKVITAMVYPLFVIVMAICIAAFLLIKIVPTFVDIFNQSNVELPVLTKFIIDMSNFLRSSYVYVLIGLVAFGVGMRFLLKVDRVKEFIDRLSLRVFIIGPLMRKVAVARISRSLATMVKSGIPILDTLDIIAGTSGNKVIADALLKAREDVAKGEILSKSLRESGVFPPMMLEMLSAGEHTGAVDDMMDKVADFFEDEVDAAVEALTSMVEPLMLVFIGGFIGTIVIALYLPIFKLAGAVGG
jgi:type IV pilus assembly protein PilC